MIGILEDPSEKEDHDSQSTSCRTTMECGLDSWGSKEGKYAVQVWIGGKWFDWRKNRTRKNLKNVPNGINDILLNDGFGGEERSWRSSL